MLPPRLITETIPSQGAPRIEESYYFATATAAKSWVMIDVAVSTSIAAYGTAAKLSTGAADIGGIIGCLDVAAEAGRTQKVVQYGVVRAAKSDTSPTALGEALVFSGTDGTAKKGANTDMNVIGIALAGDDGAGGTDTLVKCL